MKSIVTEINFSRIVLVDNSNSIKVFRNIKTARIKFEGDLIDLCILLKTIQMMTYAEYVMF